MICVRNGLLVFNDLLNKLINNHLNITINCTQNYCNILTLLKNQ